MTATPTTPRKRVAVLISGRGSNMMALVEAAREPTYPADIVGVVSNRPEAAGLAWARAQGLPARAIDHRAHATREAFEAALGAALEEMQAELVCLAGFMRLLTGPFVEAWAGRMLNIHPSLLPAFPGLDTHARVLAAGVRISGCTVHFVVPEMDAGPIVAQAAVAVATDDTPDSLAARVLEAEHRLYPLALRLVSEGTARMEGGRVITSGGVYQQDALFSPPLERGFRAT
ncbi:MAG TPA: phosphoribosylglycinamide formyltransferase [Hyphomicrobiaceae bacterium]|nr:phosphoribosylglycinamide formyltransferase [Hyphomicrobiaceae bacterium]